MDIRKLKLQILRHRQGIVRSALVIGLVSVAGYLGLQASSAATYTANAEAENGARTGNYTAGDTVGASNNASVKFGGGTTPPTPSPTITNLPAQPAALFYGNTNNAAAYAHPGALVVADRNLYGAQAFKNISAAGGSVIIYLDMVIDASDGPYHQLLLKDSACGPAVPRWPGSPKANDYGYVNDFRVGGIEQGKLECVLEKMVADNPHMAGWFADDLGTRSWFPDFSWDNWSTADKQAYRDGAIAASQTFRRVADKYGLIFIVNGTWSGGSLASNGGGYPDMSKSGNALADGGFVENHSASEISYFGPYGCSTQWAAQSPVTRGKAFMYSVNASSTDQAAYTNSGCYAYTSNQSDYGTAPNPWGSFHATGLPTHVGGPVSF